LVKEWHLNATILVKQQETFSIHASFVRHKTCGNLISEGRDRNWTNSKVVLRRNPLEPKNIHEHIGAGFAFGGMTLVVRYAFHYRKFSRQAAGKFAFRGDSACSAPPYPLFAG